MRAKAKSKRYMRSLYKLLAVPNYLSDIQSNIAELATEHVGARVTQRALDHLIEAEKKYGNWTAMNKWLRRHKTESRSRMLAYEMFSAFLGIVEVDCRLATARQSRSLSSSSAT